MRNAVASSTASQTEVKPLLRSAAVPQCGARSGRCSRAGLQPRRRVGIAGAAKAPPYCLTLHQFAATRQNYPAALDDVHHLRARPRGEDGAAIGGDELVAG